MRYSFTTPTTTTTSFTTMTDFPYSDDHNFSDVDGVVGDGDHHDYFSYSELLTNPMDSSSPSPDHLEAVAGSLGGAVTFSLDLCTSGSGPGFPAPVSAPGFINSPHDFSSLRMLQSPSIPYQQYPSSSTTEAYSNQHTTNHQLFNMIAPPPDNNTLLAVTEHHKDKRLVPVDKPTGDGYNWRKYGQKPIKNCKYSRSYYKCTQLNCPVKKQVQHSKAGRVTHIIYRGYHNHELPQPGRRANENYNHTPVPTDSEDSADAYMRFEEDEEEEACAEGSTGVASSEERASSETVTGPKIVVQTRSEVELLDDGYKWRKYGQKVVKGNCNPRSYYKCTSNGCRVRKQVERSSMEPEAVITTYEGKHDHDVPAAVRHSSSRNAQRATFCYSSTASNVEMGSGSGHGDQRPMAFLRLKEEQILV